MPFKTYEYNLNFTIKVNIFNLIYFKKNMSQLRGAAGQARRQTVGVGQLLSSDPSLDNLNIQNVQVNRADRGFPRQSSAVSQNPNQLPAIGSNRSL